MRYICFRSVHLTYRKGLVRIIFRVIDVCLTPHPLPRTQTCAAPLALLHLHLFMRRVTRKRVPKSVASSRTDAANSVSYRFSLFSLGLVIPCCECDTIQRMRNRMNKVRRLLANASYLDLSLYIRRIKCPESSKSLPPPQLCRPAMLRLNP